MPQGVFIHLFFRIFFGFLFAGNQKSSIFAEKNK